MQNLNFGTNKYYILVNKWLTAKELFLGDKAYYEELARFKLQQDIDEFKNRFGENYFIPYSILRYEDRYAGNASNPVDFKYVNAEARVFKQIMNDEDVKKFFKEQKLREAEKILEEEGKERVTKDDEALSRKQKNEIRRSILYNSRRSEYGFPKNYQPPAIQQSINDYRLSKGLTANVTWGGKNFAKSLVRNESGRKRCRNGFERKKY